MTAQQYSVISDNEGKMILDNVPDEEMDYRFKCPNSTLVAKNDFYVLSPGDEEHVIKLHDFSHLSPLERTRITSGINFNMGFEHGNINYED